MACSVIGVPKSEEESAYTDYYSRAEPGKGWVQHFQRGQWKNNTIYAYVDRGDHQKFKAYFVVNKVADSYEAAGGTHGQYTGRGDSDKNFNFPISDTGPSDRRPSYCIQKFEGPELNVCPEGIFNVPYRVDLYYDWQFVTLNLRNTPDQKLAEQYGKDGKKPNVWIVAHGMLDSGESTNMLETTNSIESQFPNDVIIQITWTGAERADWYKNPQLTDEWIRPTAQKIAELLKQWGLDDPQKISLIGHSMGTMVVTEIAREYGGGTNQIIYLDPPSYYKLPGFNSFRTDDRKNTDLNESNDAIYKFNHGYSTHASPLISRAFTGRAFNGEDGGCGNSGFNQTAQESVSFIFSDISSQIDDLVNNGCVIHGSVINSFNHLATDQRINYGKYGKFGYFDFEKYRSSRENFFSHSDEEKMNALININGTKENSSIQSYTVSGYNDRNEQEYKQFGFKDKANDYFWYDGEVSGNDLHIVDKFEKNDRIKLSSASYLSIPVDLMRYRLDTTFVYNRKNGLFTVTRLNCQDRPGGICYNKAEDITADSSDLSSQDIKNAIEKYNNNQSSIFTN